MFKRFFETFPTTTVIGGLAIIAYATSFFIPDNRKSETVPVQATQVAPATPAPAIELKKRDVLNLTVEQNQVHFIGGEINDFSVEAAIAAIQDAEDRGEELYIVLDCPGGEVFSGARLISYMDAATVKVHTIVYGMAASMCAQIHAHGDKRYMVDRSTLMFHQAAGGVRGNVKGMKRLLGYIDRTVQKLDKYVADRAGMTAEEFDKLSTDDFWVDATDAIDLGLADGLVTIRVANGGSVYGPKTDNKTTDTTVKEQLKSIR